jgi:membrane protein implicated in regulation of membrane protease activity
VLLVAIYLGALIVGGGLLVASALLGGKDTGGHDKDFSKDFDHDVDGGVDHDADHEHEHDHGHEVAYAHLGTADALWMPLLSIRFWTFFLAFFGLMGLLLEGMTKLGLVGAPWGVSLGMSVGAGAIAGYLISNILRRLKRDRANSEVVPEHDYEGKAGEVLLDVAPGDPGLVRLEVKGVSIDVTAVAFDEQTPRLKRGSKVIVLEYRDGRVVVAPFETGEREGGPAERGRERA